MTRPRRLFPRKRRSNSRGGATGVPGVPGTATTPLAADTPVVPVGPAIVVATADPSLMRMLTFALNQMRLPHQTHTSGTSVLQTLLDMPRGGRPSVVVLDVDLPGVDGHAILERLGVERPDTFLIVVLSSHADESVQVRSLLAGALDHLAKPFNVRVLMAKLQRWTTVARRCEVAA
jgi:DNA-binding response OmpR family regulator